MSKASFTPGPWHLEPQESYDGRSTHHFYRVFDGDLNAICCEEYGAHNDGGRSNMLLIAAAPDLLAALGVADEHLSHSMTGDMEPRAAIRAAIAKARGEV